MSGMEDDTNTRLSAIRNAMSAALRQKNIAEYKRLAGEHRFLLHAARPDIKAQWKRCMSECN